MQQISMLLFPRYTTNIFPFNISPHENPSPSILARRHPRHLRTCFYSWSLTLPTHRFSRDVPLIMHSFGSASNVGIPAETEGGGSSLRRMIRERESDSGLFNLILTPGESIWRRLAPRLKKVERGWNWYWGGVWESPQNKVVIHSLNWAMGRNPSLSCSLMVSRYLNERWRELHYGKFCQSEWVKEVLFLWGIQHDEEFLAPDKDRYLRQTSMSTRSS